MESEGVVRPGRGALRGVGSYLGFEGQGGRRGLVLGLLGAPGVVEFEALVAEAGPALGAALAGLLLGGFAELAHDGRADVDRLPVALHHPLQGQVPEQVAQPPLPEVHVVLAGRAREEDHLWVGRAAFPARIGAKSCRGEERQPGRHPLR